jgi:hypothetical protein
MQRAHAIAADDQGTETKKVDRTGNVPHFINEDRADMRRIKSGWYAMSNDGKLVCGPFGNYEICLDSIRL